MGYIKHHAIVVTGWKGDKVLEAQIKAKEIFLKHFDDDPFLKETASAVVSDIMLGLTNHQSSFFIAPDGSKEGWATSNSGNDARKEFLDWLSNKSDNYCDYVEIIFGGDDERNEVIRSKDSDLANEY